MRLGNPIHPGAVQWCVLQPSSNPKDKHGALKQKFYQAFWVNTSTNTNKPSLIGSRGGVCAAFPSAAGFALSCHIVAQSLRWFSFVSKEWIWGSPIQTDWPSFMSIGNQCNLYIYIHIYTGLIIFVLVLAPKVYLLRLLKHSSCCRPGMSVDSLLLGICLICTSFAHSSMSISAGGQSILLHFLKLLLL